MKKWFLALSLAVPAFSQVAVTPSVIPHITFVNGIGIPCTACKLYTYAAGTTTPLATYSDATGTSTNMNPITLDTAGGANIWVGNNSYKFILKDVLGNTIWSVDHVNAGSLFPCASAGAIQIANSATTGLTCDPTVTINTTNHTINVGTLPTNHVTIGALGTPTLWTFDTTSPATACASIGCGGVNSGLINQLAYYASAGTTVSGTTAIPAIITATTRSPGDNSTFPATTAYVALPGPINPTSVQIAAGVAMTDNQGNGTKIQHSTGTTTSGNCAQFDANGNVKDSGGGCGVGTPRTCNANGCYFIGVDGTIVEWGNGPGCGSGGACTTPITFPLPFPTAAQSVQVSLSHGNSSWLTTVSSIGTSGFTLGYGPLVYVGGSGVNLDGSETATWLAIGY